MKEHAVKDMKKAIRRSHDARLKKARKGYWSMSNLEGSALGKVLHTPAICSCYMCGNPRKFLKAKSLKEISFDMLTKSEL